MTATYTPIPRSSADNTSLRPLLPLSRNNYHEGWPDLRKTRMCPHVAQNSRCPLSSEDCKFAHSAEELRVSYDRFYKVQPCAFFDRGKCRNGNLCRFAHGEHELRSGTTLNGNSQISARAPAQPVSAISITPPKESSSSSTSTRGESPDNCDPLGQERRKAGDLALFLSAQRRGQQCRYHTRRRSCEVVQLPSLKASPDTGDTSTNADFTPLGGSIDTRGTLRNSQGGASTAAEDSPSDLVSLFSRSSSAEDRPEPSGFTPFPHMPQRPTPCKAQEARDVLERCCRLPWQEQCAFASAQAAVLTNVYQD